MTINFKCPKCRKSFKLADKLAGRRGKCPDCGSQFKIPAGRAPVTQEMPPMPDNPFGALDYDDGGGDGEAYQPRRRRRGGFFSQLLGCLFLLLLLLVALAGGAYSAVYFKLIKRDVAEPYLARIPFKIPGLTTGPRGETTAPEGSAKGPTDTAAKDGAADTKKEDTASAVPLEFRYLPDKAAFLVSINVEGLMASKLYQKLKPKFFFGVLENEKGLDDSMKAATGVPLTGLSRIILGAKTKDESISVFRTKQPITAEQVKKNRGKTDFTEVKVGKFVMYSAKKDPFCVVDERTLLIGETSDALKKILERDKPPEMVPDLLAVFKQVTDTKTISLALGPQDLVREVPALDAFKTQPELKPLFDSQAFALQIDVTAGVEISASLQCKNAADAEALKKTASENMARAYFEKIAKANAGKPEEQQAKDAIQALGQVKLGVSGDTLNATLSMADDMGANILMLATSLGAAAPPKK